MALQALGLSGAVYETGGFSAGPPGRPLTEAFVVPVPPIPPEPCPPQETIVIIDYIERFLDDGAGTFLDCGSSTPAPPLATPRIGAAPVEPFLAVRYRRGRAVTDEDLALSQAYLRGKGRMHAAWSHGPGVVWGLGVRVDPVEGMLVVEPGLALDSTGQELHLDCAVCLNLAVWFSIHRQEAAVLAASTTVSGGILFTAHLTVRLAGWLDRPVPAASCGDSRGRGVFTTVFSRAVEGVELELVPGPAPARDGPTHRRVRLLLGLEQPIQGEAEDARVMALVAELAAVPAAERAARYLEALRGLAALDAADRSPVPFSDGSLSRFPAPPEQPIVLAELVDLRFKSAPPPPGGGSDDTLFLDGPGTVDTALRPVLLPSQPLGELMLGGALLHALPSPGPRVAGVEFLDDTPAAGRTTVRLTLSDDLVAGTVTAAAFSVGWRDFATPAAPWTPVSFTSSWDGASRVVTLICDAPLAGGRVVRVIALGTGSSPLLGTDGVPLAGNARPPGVAGAPGLGSDHVHMELRAV